MRDVFLVPLFLIIGCYFRRLGLQGCGLPHNQRPVRLLVRVRAGACRKGRGVGMCTAGFRLLDSCYTVQCAVMTGNEGLRRISNVSA
jgi:hypothetical protein